MQVRIEQVLLGSPPLLLCFTVSQLLAFYGTTVDRLLGSEGQLTEVLVTCHQLAKRVFHEQLKRRGDQLVRSPPPPPKDLSPPQQVRAVILKPSLLESAGLISFLDLVRCSEPARIFWIVGSSRGKGPAHSPSANAAAGPCPSMQRMRDRMVHE